MEAPSPTTTALECYHWPLGALAELPAASQPVATVTGGAARRKPGRRPVWEAAKEHGETVSGTEPGQVVENKLRLLNFWSKFFG